MLKLKNVTIVSVAGVNAETSLKAIKYSQSKIQFAESKLITPSDLRDNEVEVIKCKNLNYEEYNYFIVYELYKYINTDFALVVQNDGFVVNESQWTDSFLKYDYIGALWPIPKDDFSYKDSQGDLYRVGNGGFSLRSKRLMGLADKLNLEWKEYFGYFHEDGFICVHNRKIYEKNGCVFADIETASKFSHETDVDENRDKLPFGFHGKNHPYYKLI
jgi:signal peptidase I